MEKMETRKIRTPSARMLASKQDEIPIHTTPKTNTIAAAIASVGLSKLDQQFVRKMPVESSPSSSSSQQQQPSSSSQIVRQIIQSVQASTPSSQQQQIRHPLPLPKPRPQTPEEEIDVSSNGPDMGIPVHQVEEEIVVEDEDVDMEMQMGKPEKIPEMIMAGDFSVANEVVISSMKYQGRPSMSRKMDVNYFQRHNFNSGESLCLKNSDLSLPNKAAHFLYFRCYDEHEVQKEFPLTIDEQRKGPQNFLVEPRVGLKNTDYYIDSYLWNRGKSTSSKKRIFVSIENNHVKTSRRASGDCHYVLNWYYSNMENRICKKVCWLETVTDAVRASPVLVQYLVNYLSAAPIECRKTPKLYSDTRSVAQELLRSDSPLETVQRFVETGETDPREIINKKQAYEMRRYVLATARKRGQRKFDDMYFDDEMFEEVHYNEYGEPMVRRHPNHSEAGRAAHMAVRLEGRRLENRIARILDSRLPAPKNHTDMLSEWIHTLESANADTVHLVINDVVGSMRKQLDEMMGETNAADSYIVHEEHHDDGGASTSTPNKRMKMMVGEVDEEEEVEHVVEEEVDGDGNVLARRTATGAPKRFEGERYIFEGEEYVEEEVITEEIDVVPPPEEGDVNVVEVDPVANEPSEVFFHGSSSPSTSGGPPKPVEQEEH